MIDKSAAFNSDVQGLRVFPRSGKFIHGDWRDVLAGMSESFDVILGDLVLGNVPYSDRPSFLGAVCRALTPQGRYVEKVLTGEARRLSVMDLQRRFERRALNLLTLNDFANAAFFRSELQNTDLVRPNELSARYRGIWQARSRMIALLDAALPLFPRGAAWYYGRPWEAVMRTYRRWFTVTDNWLERDPRSPFYRGLRIVVWKPERS